MITRQTNFCRSADFSGSAPASGSNTMIRVILITLMMRVKMMTNSHMQFLISTRQSDRQWIGFWNKWDKKHVPMSFRHLNITTRNLVDEIRRVEKRLGRPHRYLPKAGFYQGRIPS